MNNRSFNSPILTIFIALISFFIGTSIDLWGLDLQRKTLYEQQKPYLSIKSRSFGDKNKYLYTSLSDGALKIEMQFELSNTGSSLIKDITRPNIFLNSFGISDVGEWKRNTFQCPDPVGSIDLLPSESIIFSLASVVPSTSINAAEAFLSSVKNGFMAVPVNLEFYYKNDAEPPVCMKTFFSYDVFEDKVVLNYDKTEPMQVCERT